MGGINPQKPRSRSPVNLLATSQRHSKSLFGLAAAFFEAHCYLEDAVLQESEGGEPNLTAIEDAKSAISKVAETFRLMSDEVSQNKEEISNVDDWQPEYYKIQIPLLEQMQELASELSLLLSKDTMILAAKNGELQKSMWHKEQNHKIRIVSMKFIDVLMNALTHHVKVVEETNRD
ncbi:MAG: hypothetical protein MI685_03320 [Chlorobiales bacterium]|nr:hypothetical protein [Chlorobiales bacterium]